MIKIAISNTDVFSLVDDEFKFVDNWKWQLHRNGYACRAKYISTSTTTGKKTYKTTYLHRIVMEAKEGEEVDHINRDKLDNRKENLRLVTHQENHRNRGKQSNNKSGIKGVSWDKQRKKWVAYIQFGGKNRNLGGFENKKQAGLAYERAVKEYSNE